jgi:hypothetical protein
MILLRRVQRTAALLLLVGAAQARAASLSLEGNAVVLGRTESIGAVIRVDEPPGTEELPLRLSVNVGSFSDPVRIGPGKYRAVYVPPETRFPQVALVAVWRETGYDAHIDFLRIPLFGVTKIEVSAKPKSEVKASMGFDVFGPVRADRTGKAVIPLVVPPNVYQATVTVKEPNGAAASRMVPVEVPPYNRLTAALVPHAVVADGQNPTRLDVLYDLGGVDVSPDQVHVKASVGSVTFQRAARGLYVYQYLPPAGTSAKEVLLSVTVATDPTAGAKARLSLGLPPPARILIHPPGKSLVAGSGETATASALVLDSAGLGLAGQTVNFTANGQAITGPVRYAGSGVYEVPYPAPAAYPPGGLVQFQATATDHTGRSANGSANYQLLAAALPRSVSVRFSPSPVPADGRTEAEMVLDVRDAAGLPLARTQLILVASHGTLGKLTERGQGLYVASYVAPTSVPDSGGFVRVVDPSGAFERILPLPMREDPHRLLLGVRGGYTRGLGDLSGPRLGLDVIRPFRLGGNWLKAGLSLSYGKATRTVTSAGQSGKSEADFVPVSLRLGWEVWSSRRLSVDLGAGALLTLARFKNALAVDSESATGFGGLGFLSAVLAVGPGSAFAEVSYSYAPANAPSYKLDAGGIGFDVGYRVGIF